VLAAILRVAERFAPEAGGARDGGGLAILAAGTGALLPAGTIPGGEERLSNAILVGDAILRMEPEQAGLTAAVVLPAVAGAGGFALAEHERFDPAGSAEEVARLARFLEGLPRGAVLVLANRGRFAPSDPAVRRDWRGRWAGLGARSDPWGSEPTSWALLTRRGRDGWRALAEARSEEVGVVLAYALDDAALAAGGPGDFVEPSLEEPGEVELEQELGSAERDPDVVFTDQAPVGGVRLPAIFVPPGRSGAAGEAPERVVRWRGVRLGAEPVFRAGVGLRDGGWERSDGVEFALLVDGQEIARVALDPAAPPRTWRPLVADLAAWAGGKIELTLVVRPVGHAQGDWALVGLPRLGWNATLAR